MQWWQKSKITVYNITMLGRVRREGQAISNMEICKLTLLQRDQKRSIICRVLFKPKYLDDIRAV